MYLIRVMSKVMAPGDKGERNFQCEDYTVTSIPPGHPFTRPDRPNQVTGKPTEPGLYFDGGAPEYVRIVLPKDGHTIFVMNESGQTVHTYRWPIDNNKKSNITGKE